MDTIDISPKKFMLGCFLLAAAIWGIGFYSPLPSFWVAIEVFVTVIGLFIFGSMKYRVDKNALTYGMLFVIIATFWWHWWPTSTLKNDMRLQGFSALTSFITKHFLTLRGLDHLVHMDTMLFILGLTFFVAVIAQTRLLESFSFAILKKNKGSVLTTVALLIGIVSFASGILDGVSMIGLMIRILVMIFFMARVRDEAIIYAVIVSTIVTTVCGMWLAYGEPPNLIMKANLHPHLDNAFFLRYCLPVAVVSYCLVYFNIRKRLKGMVIPIQSLDILDTHMADVRFLQAARHGQVSIPTEFINNYESLLGSAYAKVEERLHHGEPLGSALLNENIPTKTRRQLLGEFLSEDLADALDDHYQYLLSGNADERGRSERKIREILESTRRQRVKTQIIGGLAFLPFMGLLVIHAVNHEFPLFFASIAAFLVALMGVVRIPKTRSLILHEGKHEYKEYLFLFPLFLSVTLLQKTGFFEILSTFLHVGIEKLGIGVVAYIQFAGAAFLSAILDNNVVADFASHALHGLELTTLKLFSMAQIAGYAAGGCWTHIGCAQSVVAYAFIQRELDKRYTPFQWMKAMTPLILEIFVFMVFIIYIESTLLK